MKSLWNKNIFCKGTSRCAPTSGRTNTPTSATVIIAALIALILTSCTDWKSLYYQSQMQLQKCEQVQAIKVDDSPVVVPIGSDQAAHDTILIQLPEVHEIGTDPQPPRTLTKYVKQNVKYEREYTFAVKNDSVRMEIKVINEIRGDQLFQRIMPVSVTYPRSKRVEVHNIEKPVDKWKAVSWGAGVGVLVVIVGFFVLNRWRTR